MVQAKKVKASGLNPGVTRKPATNNVPDEMIVNQSMKQGAALMGYNVYYQFDGGAFDMLDFTEETTYTHADPGIGTHCYYVTAVYDEGESEATNTVCEEITGIGDNLASQVRIFPNPAVDFIYIQSGVTINNVLIYNFAGQVVANEKVSANEYKVNVSNFNPGVYVFQIDTDQGRITHRVIVE